MTTCPASSTVPRPLRDTVNGAGICISAAAATNALPGADGQPHAQGRCGYGMRQPLIVVSSWAKKNSIDHTLTDQSSILRFIEDTFPSSKRIGNGSFDSIAGSLTPLFDFSNGAAPPNLTPRSCSTPRTASLPAATSTSIHITVTNAL